MRCRLLMLVLVAAGCRDSSLLGAQGDLRVEPSRLDFPTVWAGNSATAVVTVGNAGRGRLEVTLAVTPPFEVTTSLSLGGGAEERVTVTLPASGAGDSEGVLTVSGGGRTVEVTLHAHVDELPECEASACHVAAFDPVAGVCVEVPGDDGAPCGGNNACLIDGVCSNGTCTGTPLNCDDGDACTRDSCGRAVGCRHDAVECAEPTNPCRAAHCDPATGCGEVPVDDGVSCGTNDCTTARVCIGGACVTRPSPDGSQCAPAQGCVGPSTCVNATCTAPAPTTQTPAWRYGPVPEHELVFRGHVDNNGNAYLFESYFQSDSGEVDTLVTELVSFTPAGALRFREVFATACNSCRSGVEFALDTAGNRLFYVLRDELVARSLTDGRVLWHVPHSAGVPVYDGLADGGGSYWASPPMLVGTNAVAVPLMEGVSDHHAYIRVFDRATGALSWQYHRKGHLYGPGVSGNGDLWTSSANCWAPAGEVSHVATDGRELGSRFHSWIPQSYGDDVAYGWDTNTNKPHSLDGTLALTDLSPALGVSAIFGPPLVLGSRYVFRPTTGGIASVDLLSGARFEIPESRTINGVQLLRSGGIGWAGPEVGGGGYIHAVDADGAQLYACPVSTTIDGSIAIVGDRLYARAGLGLVVFSTPGLDASPRGWIGDRGSPERSGRAR